MIVVTSVNERYQRQGILVTQRAEALARGSMIITGSMVKKMCDELEKIDSLIPDNLKEAHKGTILYGRGCFIVDKDGITPIGQGELYKNITPKPR